MVVNYLGKKSSRAAIERGQDASEREEWGPFAAQAMCEETSKFPVPIGDGTMTLGDVYELTPKDMVSKVMLEEKVFDTWYSGRIVLLGDCKCTLGLWSNGGMTYLRTLDKPTLILSHPLSMPQIEPCWRTR